MNADQRALRAARRTGSSVWATARPTTVTPAATVRPAARTAAPSDAVA